jgi:hypothetical protein
LFVFQNKWETYSFPLGDSAMRDTLNLTPKGTKVHVSKITPSTRLVDSDSKVFTRGGITLCFQYNRIFRANPCSNPLQAGVMAGAFLFGIGYGYDMDIDWGDGSSHTIDNINWGDESWLHTYSTAGTYTIVSTLNTSCGGPITFISAAHVTVGDECDNENQEFNGWEENGTVGMIMQAWSRKDVFGSHAGAISYCNKKIGGMWHLRRGEVYVDISGDFRDSQCTVQDSDFEPDDCGNCKSKRAVITVSTDYPYHITGDVISNHEVNKDNIIVTGSIEIQYNCN